jgi:long-chain fatty acid transport protein
MPYFKHPEKQPSVTRVTRVGVGLIAVSCLCQPALATNGYSPTGFGTTNKGLAGAGVALPQDAMAAATNPAGMGLLAERTDVGLAFFSPSDRGYTANDDGGAITPGDYTSENDLFFIPHIGWNKPLSDHSSIGISIGGNGGMNTEYDNAVFENFNFSGLPEFEASSPTGVDFAQLFLGVTYAHEVSDGQWLGVMPILAYQRFKATGLEPFKQFSTSPDNVTNNDYDSSYGYGVRIGWLGKLSDSLSFGASYQSRLYMTEFDDYKGLFAEQGDFDTPSTWTVGLAYNVVPDVTLLLDYQRINYGEINSLSNENDLNIFANPNYMLGQDEGLGFGWEDMDIVKLGVQWVYDPKWTFRAGYSHGSKVFDGTQGLFNILAPATIRDHVSLGTTYAYSDNNQVNMSFTHALEEEVDGTSPFTGDQTGSVQMEQWELELSWSYLF